MAASEPALTGAAEVRFVGYDTLEAACRRLTLRELEIALKHRYLPIAFGPEPKAYVAAGPGAPAAADAHDIPVVGTAEPGDMIAALQAVHGRDICGRAAGHLVHAAPEFSARWRLSAGQGAALAVMAAALAAAWYAVPIAAAVVTSVVFGVVFLAVCAIRLLGLLDAPPPPRPPPLGEAELPVYTILVPLFRETRVLDQLITALCRLDYPALCIKRTKGREGPAPQKRPGSGLGELPGLAPVNIRAADCWPGQDSAAMLAGKRGAWLRLTGLARVANSTKPRFHGASWTVTISRFSRACHRPLGNLPSELGLKARRPGYANRYSALRFRIQ